MDADHFTDDEVELILARASERQENAARRSGVARSGLTLAELREAASEAGIDPAHVSAAARELALRRSQGLPGPVVSDASEIAHLRVIRGRVGDSEWDQIVQGLRSTFKVTGIISQFGEVREWSTGEVGVRPAVRVRLEPDGDSTAVSIRQDVSWLGKESYAIGGSLAGVGALASALFQIPSIAAASPPWGLSLALMGIGLGLVVAGRVSVKNSRRKLNDLFRRSLDQIELRAMRRAAPGRSTETQLLSAPETATDD